MIKTNTLLKWAGGKKNMLSSLWQLIPEFSGRYIEPFIGGGALFFSKEWKSSIISDNNTELINFYVVIKNNPKSFIKKVKEFEQKHSKEFYYQIREIDRTTQWKNKSSLFRAARFFYLNKTCYNGLYRENRNGFFNTPIGSKKEPFKFVYEEEIIKVHKLLLNTEIRCCSYQEVLNKTNKDDFVYLDPPYQPLTDEGSFNGYGKEQFLYKDQIELVNYLKLLNQRGTKFLLSNHDTPLMRNLYKDFDILTIDVVKMISCKSSSRKKVGELLVKNF